MYLLSFLNATSVTILYGMYSRLCYKLYMGHGAEYQTGEIEFISCNVHRKYKTRIRDECLSE